ncbi:hypothetical protein KP509_07G093800 [Ceratopteris richardii]|uniref:Endoplasmic reticulum-Golgi intermediate compartment protein 3 n=1 Tax=Ceratopteris richardii TaxID=49495 RepID=A0A8T2UNW3_CERRI|nr:hypothetical protein KP509_07G093800 [Ceratopteris richardii]
MGLRFQVLKNFDAFPHAEDHLTQKTSSGAIVSLVGLLIMLTLFVHELQFYLTTVRIHEMAVDHTQGETLPIHINMTFPGLPCQILSVDAMDVSGKHEVDLDTNIWKLRLHKDGYILGSEYVSDLVERGHNKGHASDQHHKEEDETHNDGEHHHSHVHSHFHTFNKDPEKTVKEVKEALRNHEGCRVFGVLDVERVAGNFHVSIHGLSIIVAQQIFESMKQVNVSHIIHDLSFGPKYPGIHNPLDGTERFLHDESGTFKYYLKIVPTEYKYLKGEAMKTNQFSVTEYFTPLKGHEHNWPAVYFVYDLSPISVTIKEERRSFTHFITRLCAVLGGTFALTGNSLKNASDSIHKSSANNFNNGSPNG